MNHTELNPYADEMPRPTQPQMQLPWPSVEEQLAYWDKKEAEEVARIEAVFHNR